MREDLALFALCRQATADHNKAALQGVLGMSRSFLTPAMVFSPPSLWGANLAGWKLAEHRLRCRVFKKTTHFMPLSGDTLVAGIAGASSP